MQSNLFKILDFLDGNKWFVIAEKFYNNQNYKYLIKLTDDEEDFIEEFKLIKYFVIDGSEYMSDVTDAKESEAVMKLMYPEIEKILKNKKEILEKIG